MGLGQEGLGQDRRESGHGWEGLGQQVMDGIRTGQEGIRTAGHGWEGIREGGLGRQDRRELGRRWEGLGQQVVDGRDYDSRSCDGRVLGQEGLRQQVEDRRSWMGGSRTEGGRPLTNSHYGGLEFSCVWACLGQLQDHTLIPLPLLLLLLLELLGTGLLRLALHNGKWQDSKESSLFFATLLQLNEVRSLAVRTTVTIHKWPVAKVHLHFSGLQNKV